MSQKEFLQEFDDFAFEEFLDAGLADSAMYYPKPPAGGGPAPEPVPCTVLVDRNVEDFGDDAAPVSALRTRVTFQRAQVEPDGGARVVVDGEAFTLAGRARQDESISAWWVQHA